MTIKTLAGDLFAVYRRNLAAYLECSEDELREVTARLADEDFEALAAAQNAAEEAAWAEARWADPEWPRAGSEEEDEIAEAFRSLLMEAGY